jgi:DNA repair protein RecO (recombination protein O)
VYRTEALVLKGYDFGEADRILTLYTPNAGKLRVIAKGVRRTKSRMGGHLDLFTRSSLLVARGRQLDIVTQAETLESFRPMRDDLWRLSHAHYVAELVDNFTAEQFANFPLYSLTIVTLRRLSEDGNVDLIMPAFELQLLALTGYRPQLHRCLNCDAPIVPGPNLFSAKMGGALCPACAGADRAAQSISVEALKALRNLQTNESAMMRLPDLPASVSREVEARLQEYIAFRMEARPRSLKFLDQLRAEGAVH